MAYKERVGSRESARAGEKRKECLFALCAHKEMGVVDAREKEKRTLRVFAGSHKKGGDVVARERDIRRKGEHSSWGGVTQRRGRK